MDWRNTCVNASVLLISEENTSLPDIEVKGVSAPRACAIPIIQALMVYQAMRWLPMAMAVFPVPGWPAIRTALPAILPS